MSSFWALCPMWKTFTSHPQVSRKLLNILFWMSSVQYFDRLLLRTESLSKLCCCPLDVHICASSQHTHAPAYRGSYASSKCTLYFKHVISKRSLYLSMEIYALEEREQRRRWGQIYPVRRKQSLLWRFIAKPLIFVSCVFFFFCLWFWTCMKSLDRDI